jgi:SAM-dependent methyltransferase
VVGFAAGEVELGEDVGDVGLDRSLAAIGLTSDRSGDTRRMSEASAGRVPDTSPVVTYFADADAYDRFMGRYSTPLAPQLADLAGVRQGQRVLDVGCGPGAMTAELVARLGTDAVLAADPSEPFVEAVRRRHPGVQVAVAGAEQLPFDDKLFDAALAQLVVSFMADPVAGLAEMRRVTRGGGVVAACVWDHGGGRTPMAAFWQAVHGLHPDAPDETRQAGAREGHLAELFEAAGVGDVEAAALHVTREHATFEDWWQPLTLGVGPAGRYLAELDDAAAAEVRERCRGLLGDGPVVIDARAWAAIGHA